MRKKKQEKTNIHIFKRQGKGDGRTARRHHTGILRRGVWCSSRRPPLGVCLFLSLLAVSRQFSPRSSMPPRGLVLTLVVLSPAASSSDYEERGEHLEHLECSQQPHTQGRGARTVRSRRPSSPSRCDDGTSLSCRPMRVLASRLATRHVRLTRPKTTKLPDRKIGEKPPDSINDGVQWLVGVVAKPAQNTCRVAVDVANRLSLLDRLPSRS